jgi:CDGSH-type Zn-finger protein
MSDDLPVGICPNCRAATLRPIDDLWTEIERRVFTDTELWACACGYSEERPAPDDGAS